MNSNNGIIILILLIVIALGGYLLWKEQHTATIDLPGDARIEIQE